MGYTSFITEEMLDRFSQNFKGHPQRRILSNAIIKNGINSIAMDYQSKINMQYTFSNEIETPKVTNQQQSGRCWLFAALNTLRIRVMKKCYMEDFELSQNYMMFWDKLEKANYFLENILETIEEDVDSRIVSWLLASPVQDGGQWDMFCNLVEKYGVVPKYAMPETFHSSQSGMMNRLLTLKLREDAAVLRKSYRQGDTAESLQHRKENMVNDIYQLLCQFLGEPPRTFDFEYRDKDKNFFSYRNLTPVAFYKEYVDISIRDYVSIINAPTQDKPYNKSYTVKYLGNVKDGRDVRYLNVDIDTFKGLALSQLKDNEPVWFGCDVGQMMDSESGIMDTGLFHYAAALDVPFTMSKEERLDYRESCLTHAMVFTGVNLVDGKPNRWKVENSWGEKRGKEGFFIMSDPWFDEYMYQVVIHKKYLSSDLLEALQQEPIILSPWDPMGSLAVTK